MRRRLLPSSRRVRIFHSAGWVGLALSALLACQTRAPVGPLSPPDPTLDSPIGIETQQPTALEKRLEGLVERLEEERATHHVPGMAIAIVKDDALVFARGFGSADLEGKIAATPETVFSIGSSSKAFTATLVGMVGGDGKLDWDDPIEQHVPEFKLAVDAKDKSARATLRDALSHRTGFTRMSLLWVSGEVPRKELLAQASAAEPWAKLRERFLYNNVTYAAAGEAAARAADTTWSELLTNRILGPLGMSDTTVDHKRANDDPRRAQGYVWRSAREEFEALPLRDLTQIGPAGGIYSNVLDMSKWVRLQLGKGKFEGKEIVPDAVIAETWKPQTKIAAENAYGLGWFLEQWNGKQVLHHGGNIDGYSAMVALMPEERLGFVLLTNVSATPLQNLVRSIVWDAALAPDAGSGSDEDLSPFLGAFMANFGPFKDVVFDVTSKGGALHVNVPGQTNYEVKPAGKDGRRPFAVTDTIKVSFEKGADGKVNVMRMHQGGLDFELLRKGYIPPAEIPIAELETWVGEYTSDKIGSVRVLIQNNRLAVDIPKQMVFELRAPDEKGLRKFRIKPDLAVAFEPKNGKAPAKMVLHESGQTVEFVRARAVPKSAKLPSVAALQKKRGLPKNEKALRKAGAIEVVGRVRFAQSGVEGAIRMVADADQAVITLDLGRYGKIEEVILRDRAWSQNSFSPKEVHSGKFLTQARAAHPLTFLLDWTRAFDEVVVRERGVHKGKDTLLLEMTKGELTPYRVSVDAATGDVVKVEHVLVTDGQGSLKQTIEMSDFRAGAGIRFPRHVEMSTDQSGRVVWSVQTIRKLDPAAAGFPG